MLKLYDYFRSSAAYRVRIALRLKKLDYRQIPVHLIKDGGHQFRPDYRALNPQARVPSLDIDGAIFTQSLAIIEYLDETHPQPAFLPADAAGRARARAMAQLPYSQDLEIRRSGLGSDGPLLGAALVAWAGAS